MKKNLLLSILSIFLISCTIKKEVENKQIPEIVDMDNNEVFLDSYKDNVLILNLWATWCKPCKAELNTIAEEYDDWVDETGVKLIAVSIDDARSSSRVEPYVNAQGWEYLVLMDPNSDLRRAMGVNNVPHTFLVNGEGKIVWDHNNYSPGDEEELYEKLTGL